MKLHKEGRLIIPITLILVSALNGSLFLFSEAWLANYITAAFSLTVLALIINFFRNPDVQVKANPAHILSPCDGKVVVIEERINPEGLEGKRKQISIFMSPLNVHVNRAPWGGKLVKLEYRTGQYLVAWNPKSSTDNEQTFLVVENNGIQIGFKQIAGALARRICWYVKEGDILEQGQEFGFIRFGSRMDVFVPENAIIKIELGQTVKGGSTLLATI